MSDSDLRRLKGINAEIIQRQWSERRERIMKALKDIYADEDLNLTMITNAKKAGMKGFVAKLQEVTDGLRNAREILVNYVAFKDAFYNMESTSTPSPVS